METKHCVTCDHEFTPTPNAMILFKDKEPKEGWKCYRCMREAGRVRKGLANNSFNRKGESP